MIAKTIFLALALLLSSCEFVAPDVSKARTENRQYDELKKQNEILERIAKALEKMANKN